MFLALALVAAAACGIVPSDAAEPEPAPANPEAATITDAPRGGQADGDRATAAAAAPAATPRGEPAGAASEGIVGPEGGTVRAADGRLTVEVPPGALATPTRIAIRPLDRESPHGVGTAYRIAPEGLTFARPVRLHFHYTDEDAWGRAPGGFGVAFQQADGTWSAPVDTEVDLQARRVTVSTIHFSDWSLFERYTLVPAEASVAVDRAIGLEITRCVSDTLTVEVGAVDGRPGLPLTQVVRECGPLRNFLIVRDWSVNGVTGGDATHGTVAGSGGRATFRAPARVPERNPVAVSVEVRTGDESRLLLASNLQITQPCPAPVCQYVGRAEEDWYQDENREFSMFGSASVVWDFHALDGTKAIYLARGRVDARWQHRDCTITLSPGTHVFQTRSARGDGVLEVDFSKNPPRYSGRGQSSWPGMQVWSCPQSDPHEHEEVIGPWFQGHGVAAEGGRLIQGSVETSSGVSRYRFRAP